MTQYPTGHIFISYSRIDEEVMRRVVTYLRSQGFNVWVDNEKLIPGTPVWETEIEKAIFGASATVVILSPNSKASEWVRREISYTERYQKRIFPVLVSGDENSSVSIRLTNHQYVDLRNDEAMGLERLSVALSFYLEDLETRKRRPLEDAEEQAQAQAKREQEEREATRLRLERERAEQEKVEREKVAQKWAEQEKLAGWEVDKEKPANQPIESRVAPMAAAPSHVKKAPEKKLVSREQDQPNLKFRWFPVLLMALGWAVVISLGGSLLSMLLNMGVSQPNSFQLLRSGIGILIGALGGLLTALSLWLVNIVSQKKSILVITLGWAVGWVVGWGVSYAILTSTGSRVGGPIGGALGGAIAGLAIAYSLRDENIISQWKSMLIVILGWSFGWAIAETLYLINGGAVTAINIELIGWLIGGIGGTVLIWQTGTRPDSRDGLRHSLWGPVLGITLGWAFGLPSGLGYRLPLGKLFGMSSAEAMGSDFGWTIGLVAAGALAGGITGVSLWRGKVLSQRKTVLWIMLGWMLALPLGRGLSSALSSALLGLMNPSVAFAHMLDGLVQGALGGAVMAFILRMEDIHLVRRQIITLMLAWGIGLALYWTVPPLVLVSVQNSDLRYGLGFLSAALSILFGAFVGLGGGYILIQQIRLLNRVQIDN